MRSWSIPLFLLVLGPVGNGAVVAQIPSISPPGMGAMTSDGRETVPRGRLYGTPTAYGANRGDEGQLGLRGADGQLVDDKLAPALISPPPPRIGETTYIEGLTSGSPFSGSHPPVGLPVGGDTPWTWQLLPASIIYKSYLASTTEPRMGTNWQYMRGYGWVWNGTLGARVGLLRYGTENDIWPEGWQLDLEGAAFPRLDAFESRDLIGADYRVGVPLTFRRGPWEGKFGYYHLSSHIGDEFLLKNLDFNRLNYVRENLVLGIAMRPHPDWRYYFEVGYAFIKDGGAKPWELQFGTEYSPAMPTTIRGAPFAAVNCHLNQATNFSGNVDVQAGWQWRGETGHLFRIGADYFNGMSDQAQFFNRFEDRIGFGMWYDF